MTWSIDLVKKLIDGVVLRCGTTCLGVAMQVEQREEAIVARVPAEQRRRDLQDAAFRVMARDGVAATSTRAICSEAGVAQSVFHYCFRSKEELLKELTRTVVAQMIEAFHAIPITGIDLEDALTSIFDGLLQTAIDAPDQQLVLYELTTTTLREPELADLAAWQYEESHRAISMALEHIASELGFEWSLPMPVLARMFNSIIDGLILSWLADRDTDQARRMTRVFARQIAVLTTQNA